jgi:general secretion pathway protein M
MQPGGASEGVSIALRAVPADALAQWFGEARSNARAVPREVHLTRSTQSAPSTSPPSSSQSASATTGDSPRVRWDGTVVMSLPAR